MLITQWSTAAGLFLFSMLQFLSSKKSAAAGSLMCTIATILSLYTIGISPTTDVDDTSWQWQKPKTYYGHKVLRVVPRTEEHREFLQQIRTDGVLEVDFWSQIGPINASIDIRVPPEVRVRFKELVNDVGMMPVVIIDDVQRLIDKERRENMYTLRYRRSIESRRDFKLNKYHPLHEIQDFEDDLLLKYPNLLSSHIIGNSTEQRPLRVLKVSGAPLPGNNDVTVVKPAVWIDGGTHAREWISPATVLYMLTQMLVFYESDRDIRHLVDNVDWYFLTVANPDGYDFSWTTDRMWRKTRSRHIRRKNCYGVDPNRNFDYHWGEKGTSNRPCSELYRGPRAFSEPEVEAIASFVYDRRHHIKCFMSFHANGQLWMMPWAYTKELPLRYNEMLDLGKRATQMLTAQHGTIFLVGSIANIIYEASGSSADWAHGACNIRYAYGIELRDFGYYGFMLPASQIIPGSEEAFAAVKVIGEELVEESVAEELAQREEARELQEEVAGGEVTGEAVEGAAHVDSDPLSVDTETTEEQTDEGEVAAVESSEDVTELVADESQGDEDEEVQDLSPAQEGDTNVEVEAHEHHERETTADAGSNQILVF